MILLQRNNMSNSDVYSDCHATYREILRIQIDVGIGLDYEIGNRYSFGI